jgi:leader peptidase (prepilin peptidase)/N-methyltransferase
VNTVELVVLAIAGAVLGSFANVLIYRLPRDESIVSPGSRCPQCGTPILPLDNIPILSYFLLLGRCRHCGARISARYPLVEVLMAGLFVAVRLRFPYAVGSHPVPWVLISALLFTFLLVVITFIDLDRQLILNRLSLPGAAAGLALAAAQGRLPGAVLAAFVDAGVILLIVVASEWILKRQGMGMGDVKLAGMIGAFLGWPVGPVALYLGFLAGGLVAVTLLLLRVRGRKDPIPFGPALAVGALLALFWGDTIWRWYWRYGP